MKAYYLTTLLLVNLLLALTIAKGDTCNATEYYTFKSPTDSGQYNSTRSINRCNSVRCLYHSDCQSKVCLKLDN